MRCLTLAKALQKKAEKILFVCRHIPSHFRTELEQLSMELAIIGDNSKKQIDDLAHSNWLGTSQAQDAEYTTNVLVGNNWEWLIVDHYALDVRWESILRQTVKKIMVIDDIADRQHDCDILLDQNYYLDMESRYERKVPSHCQLLLGPRYALLRDEFKELHEQVKIRNGPIKHILVFFGGADIDNYTGLTVEVLSQIEIPNLHVDVVIGKEHPYRKGIIDTCKKYHFLCHVQTNRMAKLMASADLAIGAAGSASWERCCLGLPTVLISIADNQINIAKSIDFLGAGVFAGKSTEVNKNNLRKKINSLINSDNKILHMMSTKAFSVVDGLGIKRVCHKLSY